MDITVIIGYICIAVSLVYIFWRIYILTGIISEQQEYIEELEFIYSMLSEKTREAYNEMKRIDAKGAFEKDDEAGTTFALLKQVIDDLYEEADGTQKEEE